MAASNATLTSLWVDDGTGGSPVKTVQGTPIKTGTDAALKEDVLKFYKEQGLEPVARDAGLLDANGELMNYTTQTVPRSSTNVQMIAVPIAAASPAKSPLGQSIYPRVASVPCGSSPVVITTPQRGTLTATMTPVNKGTPQQFIATPITVEHTPQAWSAGRKRSIDYESLDFSDSKRRKGEKGGKGLRHFSMKVCEKVQKKGITSYNEVADELVTEFTDPRNLSACEQQYDQKNIRRRVYDALNVLMAMNIISKEKKEIKWIGLPTNSAQECHDLEREKQKKIDRIKQKTQQLQELILQQIAFKNLVQRNRQQEQSRGPPTSNSAIQLPFIIVNTSKKTVIDCSISNDKYEYLFNFDNTFEIHDDIEVLKRMGMAFGLDTGTCLSEDLKKAARMVPKALEPYVIEMAQGKALSGMSILPAAVKEEPGTSDMSTPASKYSNPQLMTAMSPLATPLSSSMSSLDQHADAEVATAMSHVLSRQSSYSNLTSAHDSPEEAYSESDSDLDQSDLV